MDGGPDRAITAEQIGELFEYFRDFIRRRDMRRGRLGWLGPFLQNVR